MQSLRPIHQILLLVFPFLLAVLAGLGVVVLRVAVHQGSGEAWAAAWMLAFVVGLPIGLVILAVAGALQRQADLPGIIPATGEKIPGAGQ
jgi:hypothetical protein